ncbi:MAG: septum site-determining protein MinD, partial [Deltaproteobacteria bacterium HGW-Deltaproteobacteria-21]
LSIELLGLVPMDDRVVVSTNNGIPLVLEKGSNAGEAFKRIAMRLNGDPDLPIQVPKGRKSVWQKLALKFGMKN